MLLNTLAREFSSPSGPTRFLLGFKNQQVVVANVSMHNVLNVMKSEFSGLVIYYWLRLLCRLLAHNLMFLPISFSTSFFSNPAIRPTPARCPPLLPTVLQMFSSAGLFARSQLAQGGKYAAAPLTHINPLWDRENDQTLPPVQHVTPTQEFLDISQAVTSDKSSKVRRPQAIISHSPAAKRQLQLESKDDSDSLWRDLPKSQMVSFSPTQDSVLPYLNANGASSLFQHSHSPIEQTFIPSERLGNSNSLNTAWRSEASSLVRSLLFLM
jgi:hypothetical protein